MLSEAHQKLHQELGIPADYGEDRSLPYYSEATGLVDVGPNLVGRMQRLTSDTAASWQQMVQAASDDGIRLLIVSGFRSFDYQAQLIRNKLEAGQPAPHGRRRRYRHPREPAVDRGVRRIQRVRLAGRKCRGICLLDELSEGQFVRFYLRTVALGSGHGEIRLKPALVKD
jgi:hypothetical protein